MKTIEELLRIALDKKASDLHITPHLPPTLRIDGKLVRLDDIPALTADDSKALTYSVMAPEQQQAFEKNLVHDFAAVFPNIGNFRVSALHQMNGIASVFRIIPASVPSFDDLGLPPIFKALLGLPHGLILVTGATGSGKSTTLASMIDYINNNKAANIITIEDPIEYIYHSRKSSINQLQVGRDTPNVDIALRSSLRQDPDVILIGELRDLETIKLALLAAETGHLVMSTIHANTSAHSIGRIVDVFPDDQKNHVRNILAETIQAVICQELVPRLSGGRVAAFEIMLATPAIRQLIRKDQAAHIESTIQTSGDVGMSSLEQYLNNLAAKRIISTATARSVIANRGSFII
jgi:twitching motility protein PilT